MQINNTVNSQGGIRRGFRPAVFTNPRGKKYASKCMIYTTKFKHLGKVEKDKGLVSQPLIHKQR